MRNLSLAIIAAGTFAVATIAGCGTNSSTLSPQDSLPQTTSAPPVTPPITAPTTAVAIPTVTPTPQVHVLQKSLGQWAGAGDHCTGTPQSCDLSFRITKLTNCTGGYAGEPPPAGTERKLVWIEVTTGPLYSITDLPSGLVTQFTAVDTAGVTSGNINPSTYWSCAPKGQRIGYGDENWLPGKKYAGAVEIYLPKGSVKIADGDGLWEWTIG